MTTSDETLSKRTSREGIVLQSFPTSNDKYPEVYYEIPTVVPSDQFTFIFRPIHSDPYFVGQGSEVVFVLPKNPHKEARIQDKNMTFHLTGGGYVAINWGNGLIDLTFDGNTGRLIPEDFYTNSERVALQLAQGYPGRASDMLLGHQADGKPTNVRSTPSWKVFSKFNFYYQYYNGGNEAFYDQSQFKAGEMATPRSAQVVLSFFDRIFVGAITSFRYDVDANDPWQIKYSFKFVSLPILERVGGMTPVSGVTSSIPVSTDAKEPSKVDKMLTWVWNKKASLIEGSEITRRMGQQ